MSSAPLALLLSLAASCREPAPPPASAVTVAPPAATSVPMPAPASAGAPVPRVPLAPGTRVVALGDLHGDWDQTRRVLRAAGVIDAQGDWSGGEAVVVQVGDQLDRGDQEQAILDGLDRLAKQARAAGGDVHVLLGNHEIMNAAGDLRYVTPGGWEDFADVPVGADAEAALAGVPEAQRARVAAFRPGGPYADLLSAHPVILVLGDTVFVHGGVRPEHVRYGVGRINDETRSWLAGDGPKPAILDGTDAPVWSRRYSQDPADCAALAETLGLLGAARMVVGHTVQEGGANAACDGQVWRVDVGLSRHYGGPAQALELVDGAARVISAP